MSLNRMAWEMGVSMDVLTNLISYAFAGVAGMAILSCAIRWFIFEKAGQKGWKSLIPFYSDYIAYKIAWDGRIYTVMLAASVASAIVSVICTWINAVFGMVISIILNSAVAGAYAIAGMILQFKTARAFGRNDYFAVGLYFLGNVFAAILAFGDARYLGPQGKDGIGVPKFVDDLGQRAAAAASAAATAAAQQLQQRANQQNQQPTQQPMQQAYQQPADMPPYQPQQQVYQAAPPQAYSQMPRQEMAQRPGRRAMRNFDAEQ